MIIVRLSPLLIERKPFAWAACSSDFHFSATSASKKSSGFGALNKAWMERRTVRICKAGLHFSIQTDEKELVFFGHHPSYLWEYPNKCDLIYRYSDGKFSSWNELSAVPSGIRQVRRVLLWTFLVRKDSETDDEIANCFGVVQFCRFYLTRPVDHHFEITWILVIDNGLNTRDGFLL